MSEVGASRKEGGGGVVRSVHVGTVPRRGECLTPVFALFKSQPFGVQFRTSSHCNTLPLRPCTLSLSTSLLILPFSMAVMSRCDHTGCAGPSSRGESAFIALIPASVISALDLQLTTSPFSGWKATVSFQRRGRRPPQASWWPSQDSSHRQVRRFSLLLLVWRVPCRLPHLLRGRSDHPSGWMDLCRAQRPLLGPHLPRIVGQASDPQLPRQPVCWPAPSQRSIRCPLRWLFRCPDRRRLWCPDRRSSLRGRVTSGCSSGCSSTGRCSVSSTSR